MQINLLLLHLTRDVTLKKYKTMENKDVILKELVFARKAIDRATEALSNTTGAFNDFSEASKRAEAVLMTSRWFVNYWETLGDFNSILSAPNGCFNVRDKYNEFTKTTPGAWNMSHKRFFLWTRVIFDIYGYKLRIEGRSENKIARLESK